MTTNSFLTKQDNGCHLKFKDKHLKIEIVQERIYSFFIDISQNKEPEFVLQEFKHLFIDCLNVMNSGKTLGINKFFSGNHEQGFYSTLKRCCYILINNWSTHRRQEYIRELLDILANYRSYASVIDSSQKMQCLRNWLDNFIKSNDYQELQLFAYRYDEHTQTPWINRYSSYLLVAQSLDRKNSREQQEAARKLSKQIKDKFKFELAMYIARSQSRSSHKNRYRNPSALGDDVLRLIKAIVIKKGFFSYKNLANIFRKQTQDQSFLEFKVSIQKYLFFSVQNQKIVETLRQSLSEKLSLWKVSYHERPIDNHLILRTCNRVIDYLTTEDGKEPSPLFILILSQNHPFTLVIILLKIILISGNSRNHLEARIAHLIRYYNQYPEDECYWLIHFLEIFNITFAIYAENIEYNLIKMSESQTTHSTKLDLDAYHVFSQVNLNKTYD